MANKACHVFTSTTRFGLTQALALMKYLRKPALLVLALIVPSQVLACIPAFPSEQLAREGRNVVIGEVENTYPSERPVGATVAGLSSTNSRSLASPELLVKVKGIEVLTGMAPRVITAVSPCALPLQPGERVVVATYNGRRIVYPADMYEESFRAAHGRKR